jgi:hypothetical protein
MKQLHGISVLAILAAITMTAPASAQTANPDTATMRALLAEVRQLRLALEKSILLGPKMQLMLQRVQMQDQRVARVSQQLDDVRKQISAEAAQQTKVSESLTQVEQEIAVEGDAEHRKQLEDMRGALKKILAAGPDQQLRARESEVSNALQTEQAVLNELNEKLDVIERQFEVSQPATDGQRPAQP